jgi:hypothetical protein
MWVWCKVGHEVFVYFGYEVFQNVVIIWQTCDEEDSVLCLPRVPSIHDPGYSHHSAHIDVLAYCASSVMGHLCFIFAYSEGCLYTSPSEAIVECVDELYVVCVEMQDIPGVIVNVPDVPCHIGLLYRRAEDGSVATALDLSRNRSFDVLMFDTVLSI